MKRRSNRDSIDPALQRKTRALEEALKHLSPYMNKISDCEEQKEHY